MKYLLTRFCLILIAGAVMLTCGLAGQREALAGSHSVEQRMIDKMIEIALSKFRLRECFCGTRKCRVYVNLQLSTSGSRFRGPRVAWHPWLGGNAPHAMRKRHLPCVQRRIDKAWYMLLESIDHATYCNYIDYVSMPQFGLDRAGNRNIRILGGAWFSTDAEN